MTEILKLMGKNRIGVSGIPLEVYPSQMEDKNEEEEEQQQCNNYTQAGHPHTQGKPNTSQKQGRKRTYNATLSSVRVTIIAVQKVYVLYILSVCL